MSVSSNMTPGLWGVLKFRSSVHIRSSVETRRSPPGPASTHVRVARSGMYQTHVATSIAALLCPWALQCLEVLHTAAPNAHPPFVLVGIQPLPATCIAASVYAL